MSTIAYRGGVLAADSRAFGGRYCASPGEKWKIWRLANGDRLGVTSNHVGAGERLATWFDRPADEREPLENPPAEFRLLLVTAAGQVFLGDDSVDLSGPIDVDYYAIGSGSDYALGAMAMGAGAVQAIHIAAQFDPHTGGEVRRLEAAKGGVSG